MQLKTDDLQKLEELASLKNQGEELQLQAKLGEQHFDEDTKKYISHLLIHIKIPVKVQQKPWY